MTINEKMSEKFNGLPALIGHTPMLEISLIYKGEPRIVYAKAEYYNYSGSIKDRVACHILRQAYETGAIAEGMPIAEATSCNTGIAFAAIGAYLGNPFTIFMPDWMSKERINLIESFGATIRLVSKVEGGFLPHQFSNPENYAAHYRPEGPKSVRQQGCRCRDRLCRRQQEIPLHRSDVRTNRFCGSSGLRRRTARHARDPLRPKH